MSQESEKSLQNKGELILYESDNGDVRLDVRLENDTLWLTQAALAELFQTTQQNISLHIQNITKKVSLKPTQLTRNSC